MFLAASLRMTVMTLTGIVKTCSTLRFPPERISQKDFPSMFATWTPTPSLGGKITFDGNYYYEWELLWELLLLCSPPGH